MLTCIACSKQLGDAGEDVEPTARGTPRTKEAVKSLTSQIKDMVLKFSGSYRHSKPCVPGASSSSSAAYRKGGGLGGAGLQCRTYGGMDAAWEVADAGACQYQYARSGGSTSSTPGWDFTCVDAESAEARFANGGRRWVPGVGVPGTERGREECGLFDVVMEEDGEPKEWVAQVEPGVHITFLSLPGGGNDLKRIRFSREMFNKWQAQRWWGENYDRIMELYNVQRFSRQALPTPPRSDDERECHSSYSRVGSTRESPAATPPLPNGRPPRGARRASAPSGGNGRSGGAYHPVPDPTEHILQYYHNFPMVAPPQTGGCWTGDVAASADASMTTASSRDEAGSFSVSNASDQEPTEWVEQDEPGVYITLRQLPLDGTRELRRVRFSREHFAERNAKQWWELNRERIQAQYL